MSRRKTSAVEPTSPKMAVPADIASVPVLCVDIPRAAEVAGGVSEWTVRAWIANGNLPVVKFPGVRRGETSRRVLIAVRDLEEFIRKHREVTGA